MTAWQRRKWRRRQCQQCVAVRRQLPVAVRSGKLPPGPSWKLAMEVNREIDWIVEWSPGLTRHNNIEIRATTQRDGTWDQA